MEFGISFKIKYTWKELCYKLLKKKRCPACGDRLKPNKIKEYLGKGSEWIGDAVFPNVNKYAYRQHYQCETCHVNYSITDLANR